MLTGLCGMEWGSLISSMSLYGAALMRSQEPGVNPGLLRSGDGDDAVSYTHLTLPTILLV